MFAVLVSCVSLCQGLFYAEGFEIEGEWSAELKELASDFCQANILKYGSRYGDKDGRSKRDLMKVIHYAMLLLHFDGHYNRQENGLSEFR